MRIALAAVVAFLPAAAATVDQGTIAVNRGAAGIALGMTRATVIAKLGKPVYKNANGYMQYSKKNLFDVYLNTATSRVRLIGVSGPKFCTSWGFCLFKSGGVAKLKARYGAALEKITAEDGEQLYVVVGRLAGRRVFTSFSPAAQGKVIQLFIGYCPPKPAVCGA